MLKKKRLDEISWEDYTNLTQEEQAPYLVQANGRPYHVLIAHQF